MFPWARFFLYVLVTAGTPGPNTLSSMSNGSRLGFRRTLPYIFGIWAGFSIVSTACTLLCGTLDALIPAIRKPMLVLGACYILYLAWKTWRAGAVSDTADVRASFRDGFFLQFVNPKIYIYCIVSMQSYVLPLYQGQPVILFLFALLLAFFGFCLNLCWAGFGSLLRVLFSRYAAVVNKVMALLMVWCAVRLFL